MDSLGTSSHVQVLPTHATMYSVGILSSHFRRGWQVAAMAGGVSSSGGCPPAPSAPVRPAAVTRRQSSWRTGPFPRAGRCQLCELLRDACMHSCCRAAASVLCAPPPAPRAQSRPEVSPPVFCRDPRVSSCWHLLLGGHALPGLPPAPSSQIVSRPDSP